MLGKLAGERAPDVIVCVADATNLRLVLRLVLELKQVGRPVVLALNMIDIAQRGLEIDLERLSRELGVPVVTTVAIRSGGIDELLAEVDAPARRPAAGGTRPTGASPTPASSAAPSARPSASCARRSASAGQPDPGTAQGRRGAAASGRRAW